jgi:hypothetical protein
LGARDPRRPENIDAQRRQERAFGLYIAGLTYQQIADTPDPARPGQTLYTNKGSACRAVQSAIKRHTQYSDIEEQRRVENIRIDALQRAHWSKAMQGDSWSTLRIKELMELRMKLNGTAAPTRMQVDVLTGDTVQHAIDQLLTQMADEEALAAAETD